MVNQALKEKKKEEENRVLKNSLKLRFPSVSNGAWDIVELMSHETVSCCEVRRCILKIAAPIEIDTSPIQSIEILKQWQKFLMLFGWGLTSVFWFSKYYLALKRKPSRSKFLECCQQKNALLWKMKMVSSSRFLKKTFDVSAKPEDKILYICTSILWAPPRPTPLFHLLVWRRRQSKSNNTYVTMQ